MSRFIVYAEGAPSELYLIDLPHEIRPEYDLSVQRIMAVEFPNELHAKVAVDNFTTQYPTWRKFLKPRRVLG